MSKDKKKIALLLAGGTWTTDKSGELFTVNQVKDIDPWLNTMSELAILADLEVFMIAGEEDEVTPKVWEKQAQLIAKQKEKFDGFIIVTKVDQIVNTSLALNFLLQNLPTTIIVTGSQMSGAYLANKKEQLNKFIKERKGLGLRANLVNAVQIAGQPLPAPAVIFGSRLIWGAKAIWQNQDGMNLFTGVDEEYWGKIDFGISLKAGLGYANKATHLFSKINANLLVVEDFVGSTFDWADKNLNNYQAVLLKINSPELSKEKLEIIKKITLPTVIYSRADFLFDKEIPILTDCTWPTALVKTLWVAANHKNREDFIKKIRTNTIGEFN